VGLVFFGGRGVSSCKPNVSMVIFTMFSIDFAYVLELLFDITSLFGIALLWH